MTGAVAAAIIVWAVVCAVAGALIGSRKGRGLEGFAWGFFLGLIGLVVVALRAPARRGSRQGSQRIRERAERSVLDTGSSMLRELRKDVHGD